MSRRCTIVKNEALDRLLAIERQARVLCDERARYDFDFVDDQLEELARLLGPRKE